jgi:hypothetical protein
MSNLRGKQANSVIVDFIITMKTNPILAIAPNLEIELFKDEGNKIIIRDMNDGQAVKLSGVVLLRILEWYKKEIKEH